MGVEAVDAEVRRYTRWHDDYYTLRHLDPSTVVIGEPRYHQQNQNVLLIGEDRALLFDSGPGVRSIEPVVRSLTDLPVTAVASHCHYDHIGGLGSFAEVVLASSQAGGAEAGARWTPDRKLCLTEMAEREGVSPSAIEPTRVLEDGATIALGGRDVQLLFLPGHTADSVAILDAERSQVFVGDFLFEYLAAVKLLFPTASDRDYLASSRKLVEVTRPGVQVYAAHSMNSNVEPFTHQDLVDLQRFFASHHSGWLPRWGWVNGRIGVLY